jgi:thioredoxin reductase (NADPH)
LDGVPPSNLATTVPGVYAVGDVRAGSMKRVASAAGEGASVVPAIHAWLAGR